MTTTERQRRNPMAERLNQFRTECPAANEAFPPIESVTLEGKAWALEDLAGRVVVLETGAFT